MASERAKLQLIVAKERQQESEVQLKLNQLMTAYETEERARGRNNLVAIAMAQERLNQGEPPTPTMIDGRVALPGEETEEPGVALVDLLNALVDQLETDSKSDINKRTLLYIKDRMWWFGMYLSIAYARPKLQKSILFEIYERFKPIKEEILEKMKDVMKDELERYRNIVLNVPRIMDYRFIEESYTMRSDLRIRTCLRCGGVRQVEV